MKPILFKPEMIKAILSGNKTMTRRIIKDMKFNELLQPVYDKYKVGDVLYVKESYSETVCNGIIYKADNYKISRDNLAFSKWKSALFMPKYAARIFLRVTDVRIEKLQDISKVDAIAEGIAQVDDRPILYNNYLCKKKGAKCFCEKDIEKTYGFINPVKSYYSLWEKINGTGSWNLNPDVAVICFERIEKPKYFDL